MSVSCAVTKKLRMFSHTLLASHCFAKYSHSISLSYMSILLRYKRKYRYNVALSAIMLLAMTVANRSELGESNHPVQL